MRYRRYALGDTLIVTGALFIAVSAVHAQDKPAADAAPAAASKATPITVGGTIEVNYTYNFNKPFTGQNTYLFNTKDSQFNLNLAELRIAKATDAANRAGFTVTLFDGEVKKNVLLPGENVTNVLEAYGTLLIPVGARDLKVDAGQFVTHVGYETIEVGTNNFFSHSFVFQYPEPFYNAGLRASFPFSSKFTANGYIYNRYNGVNNAGSRSIAPGFQLTYAPNATTSFIFNGLTSQQENIGYTGGSNPNGSNPKLLKPQSILNLIGQGNLTKSLRLVGEGLYRSGKDANDKSFGSYGIAGYLIYTQPNGNALALRAENFRQDKVIAIAGSGVNQLIGGYADSTEDPNKKVNLSSLTASYEIANSLFKGSRTIIEYRYDIAGGRNFPKDKVGSYSKNQSSLTIGQTYSF